MAKKKDKGGFAPLGTVLDRTFGKYGWVTQHGIGHEALTGRNKQIYEKGKSLMPFGVDKIMSLGETAVNTFAPILGQTYSDIAKAEQQHKGNPEQQKVRSAIRNAMDKMYADFMEKKRQQLEQQQKEKEQKEKEEKEAIQKQQFKAQQEQLQQRQSQRQSRRTRQNIGAGEHIRIIHTLDYYILH